jgi:RNA polymerase primary sigma factor
MMNQEVSGTDKSESGDAPLIDLNEASIKKLIAKAKRRGYITIDELNEALPQDQMSADQIEDIQTAISDMGVQIVESDEDAVDPDEKEVEEVDEPDQGAEKPVVEKKKETIERTDDPVRMYLREMGAVELLSREGEIAIAKRIEAGRDTMILGLCESPITFHAIIQWSEALNAGEMQLREILDLDAMLTKEPAPESLSDDAEEDDDGEINEKTAGPSYKEDDDDDEEEEASADGDDEDGDGTERRTRQTDDDEEDNTLSLAQMEAALKPEALEKFALITQLFKKFEKLQAELSQSARGTDRAGRKRAVPRHQDRISGRQPLCLQPAADRAGRPDAAPGRASQGAAQGLPCGLRRAGARRYLAPGNVVQGQEVGRLRRQRGRRGRADSRRSGRHRQRHRHGAPRVSPDREHGPEG